MFIKRVAEMRSETMHLRGEYFCSPSQAFRFHAQPYRGKSETPQPLLGRKGCFFVGAVACASAKTRLALTVVMVRRLETAITASAAVFTGSHYTQHTRDMVVI
jgi:hypothetical protein